MKNIKSLSTLILVAILSVSIGGCANMNRTQQGATAGSVAGGILGQLIGGNTKGTVIGAIAGGAVGAIIGNDVERKLEEATKGTGIEVVRVNDHRVDLKVPSGILFDIDSAQVNSDIRPHLKEIAKIAQDTPSAELVITGSTDSTGSAQYNQQLGQSRAQSVRHRLISEGVTPSKIEAMSIGQSKAVAEIGDNQNSQRYRTVTISMVTPEGAQHVRKENNNIRQTPPR